MKNKAKQVVARINEMIDKYGHTLSISTYNIDTSTHEITNEEELRVSVMKSVSSVYKNFTAYEEVFDDGTINGDKTTQWVHIQYGIKVVGKNGMIYDIDYMDNSDNVFFNDENNMLIIRKNRKSSIIQTVSKITFSK